MNHSAGYPLPTAKLNRGVGFVEAVEAGRSADQDHAARSPARTSSAPFDQAVAPVVAGQHDGDIGLAGAFVVNQGAADRGKPDIARQKRDDRQKQQNQYRFEKERAASDHELLLVRRILLVEIADGLQPLVQAFDFGFVLGAQDAVAGQRAAVVCVRWSAPALRPSTAGTGCRR